MAFRIIKVTPNFARMMSTSATKVGFIGLGQMGNRMATNLMSKVKKPI
jgi:predicted homoserine dehydrogenase-like protein